LDDYGKAFVAEQVALQSDDQGNPMELYHNTYLAADSTDTLHYGNMLHDPDRATFEVAMQDEIDSKTSQRYLVILSEKTTMLDHCKMEVPSVPAWWPASRRGKFLAHICTSGEMEYRTPHLNSKHPSWLPIQAG